MSENHGSGPNGRRAGAMPKKGSSKGKKCLVALAVLLLLLLLPVTFLSVYVQGYTGIFPNVYVGDIDLSGKTEAEALALLNQTYRSEKMQGLSFVLACQDVREKLTTDALGLAYQNRETVAAAMAVGDAKNPVARAIAFAKQKLQRKEILPVISYNTELLGATIDTVAKPFEVEPIGYTFEIEPDTVVIHAPVAGVKVDRNAVASRLEELFRSLVVCDIILEPVTTPPAPLDFEEFYAWLTSPAEDAYYLRDENGNISVQREKLQCNVEKDVVRAAVESIEQSGNRTAFFNVTTTEPEVLSLHLKENLFKDKLGSYTTYYSGTAARNNNVRLATSRVDGYELMPGEVFSYDQTILPRTSANGYQAAPVYVGNKVESGMGGGICQPSSTLYCAALYANLEIVERHNHSMLVSYLPAGLDATISQGVLDLKLKNNTPYPIKIAGQASGGVLTFSIWGYNPENISVEILRGGDGYYYTATRVVKKDGVEIDRHPLGSSRYVPPAPSETPEPTESAAPEETAPPEETTAPEGDTPPATGQDEPVPSATPAPSPTPAPEATPSPTPVPSATTGIILNE